MKNWFLTLLFSLTLIGSSFAQLHDKAIELTNSLYDLWHNGKTEQAVESSLELYRIAPSLFINKIHDFFAQNIEDDSLKYFFNYLVHLYNEDNQKINALISPIFLWSKVLNSKDESALDLITEEFVSQLKDSSDYYSKAERYYLLIIKELDKKNLIDNKTKEELINRIIKNLEKYSYLVDIPVNRSEAEIRAWHRYILAYSYDYLYSNLYYKEYYLEKASFYSPDLSDRLNKRAYFYDAALLTGNWTQIGFKSKYQEYLVDDNRVSEALNLLCEITFSEPTDDNLTALKEFYENSKKVGSFNTYWEGYINKQGKAVPQVKIQFENEVLDFAHKTEYWIFIDIWGTWCSPCLRELPELQSFFSTNQQVQNSKLKIYTFSYGSQNLSEFMAKNKYTFPVSEIDQQTNDLFMVQGYPTKILISPDGNFIKIPFAEDWKTYITNYTLLKN